MKFKKYFILLLFIFIVKNLPAQAIDSSLLTLDRIFNSDEFSTDGLKPSKWLVDGSGYTTLDTMSEKDKSGILKDGMSIVKNDPATGKKTVLIDKSDLVPKGSDSPLRISNYSWSPDQNLLLIYTRTARVWRYNTRGDYWLYNLKTKELLKLGGNAKPSTMMFAKFSPDGKMIGYVCGNNVYIQDLSTQKITQLTFDGTRTISNGTFDWVYEEEFDCRDGFRWSPDSKKIAFWQLDATDVNSFYLINNTDSLYSKIISVQYPKVGTTLSVCKLGIINIDSGNTKWFDIPGDKRNNYIMRMEWAANSDEIIFQRMNRKQNINEVTLGNINTLATKVILTERDSAWVDPVDDWQWLDGKSFLWLSERDGWRHIYIANKNGEKPELITKCNYDVESILSIDKKNGWIYFISSPENAAQRYLYRVKIKPDSKPERLTPEDQPGSHSYTISADAKWAFHTYSSMDIPPVIDIISLPNHETKRIMVTNTELAASMKNLKRRHTEFFGIDIGNTRLDGWMIKPYNFDSTKKYPVLFYVYGEPAAQTVLDKWDDSNYLWHLMLAQQGYIIISMDNRGTPAPRGRDWRRAIYKKIGVISSDDQSNGVRALINKWSFIDPERIGVWGWSGGGTMSLNTIFRYPELYKTAMAVAPVGDERYYDAVYQERYMGLLEENPKEYKQCSAVNYADRLKGNLLIVHGTGDDNVHYQNTEAVINALIKYNKKFTMMAYPNRTHGIYEGINTTIHLYGLLTDYLCEHLRKGPMTK
jgi:dipeptidyl-peptidase 4